MGHGMGSWRGIEQELTHFCEQLCVQNLALAISCCFSPHQGRALYGPMPVKTDTFRTLSAIGPYLFLAKFVWTNGPESSSKVSPYTDIGPWMALTSTPRARTKSGWLEVDQELRFPRPSIGPPSLDSPKVLRRLLRKLPGKHGVLGGVLGELLRRLSVLCGA